MSYHKPANFEREEILFLADLRKFSTVSPRALARADWIARTTMGSSAVVVLVAILIAEANQWLVAAAIALAGVAIFLGAMAVRNRHRRLLVTLRLLQKGGATEWIGPPAVPQ